MDNSFFNIANDQTVETKKQWLIVYTRPGCEKRVVGHLEKKGIEVYCPLKKASSALIDRKRIITVPLFPSYVFVKTSENEKKYAKETDGFVNFVYWLDEPAIICGDEIDTIKKFLIEYDHVSIEKSDVLLSDKVRILNGPLVFWEGNIIGIRTTTIKILLPSLGYSLVAEIRKENNTLNRSHPQFDNKTHII